MGRVLRGLLGALLAVPAVLVVTTATPTPASAAPGAPLYVAASGSDAGANDCETEASPCATVSYAYTQAIAGSVINVKGLITDHVDINDVGVTITGEKYKATDPAIIDGGGTGTVIINRRPSTLAFLTIRNGNSNVPTPTGFGGGVEARGSSLTITDSVITGNTAGNGAGVNASGTMNIVRTTISNNVATSVGGGILVGSGNTHIIDSTITGNSAANGGSALETIATATVFQSTIADNITGGISGTNAILSLNNGVLNIVKSTISNLAQDQNIYAVQGGTVRLAGNVIQGDADTTNCLNGPGSPIITFGYGVSSDDSCPRDSTDQHGFVDPLLLPLANNGGPTQTMLASPGSPILGNVTLGTPSTTVTVGTEDFTLCRILNDQRGASSAIGSDCDSGSVENLPVGPAASQTITFANPGQQPSDIPYTLVATSSSELTVSFTSTTPSVCTVSGTTVTFHNTTTDETCTIQADQAGNLSYAAAAPVTRSFTSHIRIPQTSNPVVTSKPAQRVGTTVLLEATGGSGTGAYVFSVLNAQGTGCVVNGTSLTATATSGFCFVTVTKLGDADFLPRTSTTPTPFTWLPAEAPPTFTSASTTTFVVNSPGSFTVTTDAFPVPTITKDGALPTGVTFTDNGDGTATIAGTPALGTFAGYPLEFSAVNGLEPDGFQSFTLVVDRATQAPVTIDSSDTGTATVVKDIAVSGGTGTGGYLVEVTGTNTAECAVQNATQILAAKGGTCDIVATRGADENYNAQQSSTQTITFAKADQAAITITPTQVTLANPSTTLGINGGTTNGAESFVLSSAGTAGCAITSAGVLTYTSVGTCTVTGTMAGNDTYNDISLLQVITVRSSPVFTSGATANFTIDQNSSFSITTAGTPTPTIIQTAGTLPGGLTLTDNVDGTMTLSGTPDHGTVGSSTITLVATNAVLPNATQILTINIARAEQAEVTVSASTPRIALDPVTLTGGGGTGTGAFSYSATPGTAGCSVVGDQVTATKAGECNVRATRAQDANYESQDSADLALTFIKKDQAPLALNPGLVTVEFGATLSTTGGSGDGAVTFEVLSANNTGGCSVVGDTLSATTVGGSCSVKATKAATDTYNEVTVTRTINVVPPEIPPTFTSANATTFTIGQSNTFAVTTNAYPVPAITKAGALPSGLTFADNGNGTATLSGIPASGTANTYTLTFTADNDLEPDGSQTFTLTVVRDAQAPLAVDQSSGTVLTPLALSATGGSIQPGTVNFATIDGTATGCSITVTTGGSTLNALTAGTCLVTATKVGDTRYLSVTSPQKEIVLAKATQPPLRVTSVNGTVGAPMTLTTGGGGGTGAVTYAVAPGTISCTQSESAPYTLSATAAGTCLVTATKAADATYNEAVSPQATVTFRTCTRSITGTYRGNYTARSGELLCLDSAFITGALSIQRGASVQVNNSTIGSNLVASTGAVRVALCNATVNGRVSVTGTTTVIFGNGQDCAGNLVRGTAAFASNKSVTLIGNTFNGSFSLTRTAGPSTVGGNTLLSRMSCTGNNPPPTNGGLQNTVRYRNRDQCGSPTF